MTRQQLALFKKIVEERRRQNTLHPKWRGDSHGLSVLMEEVGEVAKALYELHELLTDEVMNPMPHDEWRQKVLSAHEHLDEELIQVAAVSLRWLENRE